MKKHVLALGILALILAISPATFGQAKNSKKITRIKINKQEKTLYARLGGYDAIAAVTDDFAARLATDKKLGKFFVGLSDDSMKKLRQHVVDFLCLATGGPCVYTGRDMKVVHTGLEITEEEWDISVEHLKATLSKFKVPDKEKSEVLAAVGGLKKDIVEKK